MNKKRFHDLKTVYNNFHMIYRLLEENYTFSMKEKKEILKQLQISLKNFEKELKNIENLIK